MSKQCVFSNLIGAIIFFIITLINPTSIFAAGISLDLSFGTNGKVITSFEKNSDAIGMTKQSDGKIIIVGDTSNGNNLDWAIARYNTDGSLDSHFGTNGEIIKDFGGYDDSLWGGIIIQPDGKIIVGGYSKPIGNYLWTLARFNVKGTTDPLFNNNGIVTTSFSANLSVIKGLLLQSDNKIVAIGYRHDPIDNTSDDVAVARYNPDGSLDTSFGGGNGYVTTPISTWITPNDRGKVGVLQPDGKIIVFAEFDAGNHDETALLRYNSDGTLDNSFGSGGIVKTQMGSSDQANAMVLQPDGKIVVAGTTNTNSVSDTYIARYNTDGSLDATFGTGGKMVYSFSSGNDGANSMILLSNGKILLGGYDDTGISAGTNFALMQFNTDGTVDTSFGTNGLYTTPVGTGGDDRITSIALQNDGKIVAAGTSSNGSYNNWALVRYTTVNPIADFKQTDPTWSNNPNPPVGSSNYITATLLDHSSQCRDMYWWGCAITSVADVLKSYGYNTVTVNGNSSTAIDPSSFNAWMTENNIFSDCGALFQFMGSSVAIANPLPFWVSSTASRNTAKTMVDAALSQGNLPIIGVNTIYGTHFIVLSKKLPDLSNGTPDYSIIDPALYPFIANTPGNTGKALSDTYKWNNIFEVVVFDKNSSPTAKSISFVGHSPIQLLVTNPNGKQTGYQSSSHPYVDDIPQSSYGIDPGVRDINGNAPKAPESIIYDQNNPVNGIYTLQVYGTGNGSYTVDFMSKTASASAVHHIISGTAVKGKTDTYSVTVSDANDPIVVQRKVTMQVIPDKIYPKSGLIGVTILGKSDFDVKNIAVSSIRLGNGNAKPILNTSYTIDINNDRIKDLLLFFSASQTDLTSKDTQLCLTGMTKDGAEFKGCDTISVITPKLPPVLPPFWNLIGPIDQKQSSDIHNFVNSFRN
jgi:uncharacterized delta-60 repeat protein